MSKQRYIDVTQEAGAAFFSQNISGPVVMLNLLKFRDEADYSASPELAPESPISGKEAYRLYAEHSAPFVAAAGSEVLYKGDGGAFLIGPSDEQWDVAMLVKHQNTGVFLAFASNPAYLAGMGHRTAALEDSRLLPLK